MATLSGEAMTAFQALRRRKYRYVIFAVNDAGTAVILDSAREQSTYGEFVAALPAAECRFAVFDLPYTTLDGGSREKIVFFAWTPDIASTRQKMMYAPAESVLRNELQSVGAVIRAGDASDLDHDVVLERVRT